MFTAWTAEDIDAPSAKLFALKDKLSDEIVSNYFKNEIRYVITLCFPLFKKSDKMCSSSPEMSFCFNLKINLCQTYSKVLDVSNLLSKDIKISRVINKN